MQKRLTIRLFSITLLHHYAIAFVVIFILYILRFTRRKFSQAVFLLHLELVICWQWRRELECEKLFLTNCWFCWACMVIEKLYWLQIIYSYLSLLFSSLSLNCQIIILHPFHLQVHILICCCRSNSLHHLLFWLYWSCNTKWLLLDLCILFHICFTSSVLLLELVVPAPHDATMITCHSAA
jgi:hypothetical protein